MAETQRRQGGARQERKAHGGFYPSSLAAAKLELLGQPRAYCKGRALCAPTPRPGVLHAPPHLLIVALSPSTQVTNALSTYLQGFRCRPTVCSVQSLPPPPSLPRGPEVQQTQRWPDRGAGMVGEGGVLAQTLSLSPTMHMHPQACQPLKSGQKPPKGTSIPRGSCWATAGHLRRASRSCL